MLPTLLLVVGLSAQVHPCDEPLASNPSMLSPVVAGFCATDPAPTAKIFVNSTLVWQGVPTRMTSSPNSEGFYYFETPELSVQKGTHVAYVDITNGAEPLSEGFMFTIISKGQAQKIRIKGGK